jgi:Na+-transporting NADH:ubiquinone oxidoreductase subunit F
MSRKKHAKYILVGEETVLAVQKGLADAKWYSSPIPRETMRDLLKRRDGPAIRDTLLWFTLLIIFGGMGYFLWGSLWAIVPFAIYGVFYASVSDSRWHESGHGTAFKSDWMNNALYEVASFMVLRESVPWRWSHTRHHSDTIIVGRDPEIAIQRPTDILKVLTNFVNFSAARMYISNLLLHSTGKLNSEEATYIPRSEYKQVFWRARIHVLIYLGVIGLSIYLLTPLPLMYIGLPSFYGAWLMVVYGISQHAGLAENVLDHRLNSRTIYMNFINRYLYWNMGYHIEHHMFPLVPYHALPKLHEAVKDDMPKPYNGLWEAYKEIIPTLVRQATEPTFYVKRELPTPTISADHTSQRRIFVSSGQPDVDGWIEVCESENLLVEDVVRFDYNKTTYAIYRSDENKIYATDGICTHGNAHLADGLVKGNIIECGKHNGRFDIRDGSPQRKPVCVGLRTYPVKEKDGKLWLYPADANQTLLNQEQKKYHFEVVSNENVATFIKELVLRLQDGSPSLEYQPGDYLQLEIPAYEERSLSDCIVQSPYNQIWKDQLVYKLRAENPISIRRNYSLASNPFKDKFLRFNVRLAAPPPGLPYHAGSGSSYIFGLKPGDTISAIGPFGEFHIKDTTREVIYLGGGAGMAPLRSHISALLETRHIPSKVSYWYGARSLKEIFYQAYFEELACNYSNFSFHIALSEPLPDDKWNSHTGFIHEVLEREYLSHHPNPQAVDYFVCGPPVMVQAAAKMLTSMGVPDEQIAFDEF